MSNDLVMGLAAGAASIGVAVGFVAGVLWVARRREVRRSAEAERIISLMPGPIAD